MVVAEENGEFVYMPPGACDQDDEEDGDGLVEVPQKAVETEEIEQAVQERLQPPTQEKPAVSV